MAVESRIGFWLALIAVSAVLLYLLSGVLLPFVAGMAVAYFLDPVADRLKAWGLSRTVSAALILSAFFIAAAGGMVLLFPLLQAQVVGLVGRVPDLIDTLRLQAEPLVRQIWAGLPPDVLERLRDAAGAYAGEIAQWVTKLLADLLSGGMAFLNIVSLVLISPVVAFYLLRDWNRIVERLDSLLPRATAPVIREQFAEVDRTIAAFVRGQASVCLILSLFYGVGLTLLGLQSGLLVGLGAGLVSFIPYFGAALGLAVGLGIALVQFADWQPIVLVAALFIAGQTAESYILTPKLVGERVGLHPVWIIFALLAGGALFGFTGVLLAVPAAAVIGVLVRFAQARYLESPLYGGGGDEPG